VSTHKPIAILVSTLQCIAAGIITGLFITLFLSLVVILFAGQAHADTGDNNFTVEERRVKNVGEVNQGSCMYQYRRDDCQGNSKTIF
jgi:hypothetical protein